MPLFTKESAAIAGRKGALARWTRPKPPQDYPPQPAIITADEAYTQSRLPCVRAQLAQVDEAILRESAKARPDGQQLSWLAAAQERLAEQERRLAGRPLPGSRKPAPERHPAQVSSSPVMPLIELQDDAATKESLLPAGPVPTPATPTPAQHTPGADHTPPTYTAAKPSGMAEVDQGVMGEVGRSSPDEVRRGTEGTTLVELAREGKL